jgi:hypothetical protein
MSYTRRYLLTCLGYASGLGVGLRPAALAAAASAPDDAAAALRLLLDDRARARVLGGSYRAHCPAESDPAVLARLILAAVAPHGGGQRPLRRELLLPAFDRCVRDEFGAGSTVRLDGWILARTEARLCALCD